MTDPTQEILTAFSTALSGNVSYNSKAWHVYDEEPPKGKRNYIYITNVDLVDASDQDHYIFNAIIDVLISVKKDKYARTIAADLGDTIIPLISEMALSMTSYNMNMKLHLVRTEMLDETEQQTQYIKPIQVQFSTQEK